MQISGTARRTLAIARAVSLLALGAPGVRCKMQDAKEGDRHVHFSVSSCVCHAAHNTTNIGHHAKTKTKNQHPNKKHKTQRNGADNYTRCCARMCCCTCATARLARLAARPPMMSLGLLTGSGNADGWLGKSSGVLTPWSGNADGWMGNADVEALLPIII